MWNTSFRQEKHQKRHTGLSMKKKSGLLKDKLNIIDWSCVFDAEEVNSTTA